jgi:hypothetical protein
MINNPKKNVTQSRKDAEKYEVIVDPPLCPAPKESLQERDPLGT